MKIKDIQLPKPICALGAGALCGGLAFSLWAATHPARPGPIPYNGTRYRWRELTAAQAIARVRQFESDPNLALMVTRYPTATLAESPNPTDVRIRLASAQYEYSLSKFNPDSLYRTTVYKPSASASPVHHGEKAMTQAAALHLARAFIANHVSQPTTFDDLKHFKFRGGVYSRDARGSAQNYEFSFRYDCGADVSGPANCLLTIDALTGSVSSYFFHDYPVLISTKPRLSDDQITAIARCLIVVGGDRAGKITHRTISFPDQTGAERLLYFAVVHGIGPEETPQEDVVNGVLPAPPIAAWVTGKALVQSVRQGYAATERWQICIDANSGEVLSTIKLGGLSDD